ncbi:MAG: hypothetical protein EAZ19_00520 [Oscillatoriales cyanobacterium]|nr:MAG: hypothetical protein EAZ19_00520 [Oscillatoriales cyanobacterium]
MIIKVAVPRLAFVSVIHALQKSTAQTLLKNVLPDAPKKLRFFDRQFAHFIDKMCLMIPIFRSNQIRFYCERAIPNCNQTRFTNTKTTPNLT